MSDSNESFRCASFRKRSTWASETIEDAAVSSPTRSLTAVTRFAVVSGIYMRPFRALAILRDAAVLGIFMPLLALSYSETVAALMPLRLAVAVWKNLLWRSDA